MYGNLIEELIAKGYKPTDLIWATPTLRDYGVELFLDIGEEYSTSSAILIINGRNYNEESRTLYFQKDPEIRRKSLLGIVIFEMKGNLDRQRPDLRIDLEGNIEEVVEQLHQAGYFKA